MRRSQKRTQVSRLWFERERLRKHSQIKASRYPFPAGLNDLRRVRSRLTRSSCESFGYGKNYAVRLFFDNGYDVSPVGIALLGLVKLQQMRPTIC